MRRALGAQPREPVLGRGPQGSLVVGVVDAGDRLLQEARRVLCDAEEHGTSSEDPGRDRTLQGLGRADVGEARGENARRDAVIGE